MLVERVVGGGNFFAKRQDYHLLSIGRDVWEPVVKLVVGDLLLVAAIGPHPPDLHGAAAGRVEIDILTIGRVFGTIVQARCRGESYFGTALSRNLINIEFAIPLGSVNQPLTIWRPAMQIRMTNGCDAFGSATFHWYGVNNRLVTILFTVVAQTQHLTIERQYVVVVIVGYGVGINN